MKLPIGRFFGAVWLAAAVWWGREAAAETFRVATYNLESYCDVAARGRPAKSDESKAKIRESILALQPDVLALQELGSLNAFLELKNSLRTDGLDLPYWQFICAADTNIHLGLLSRFPFAGARLYTNESFMVNGRRCHVSRGFAEAQIRLATGYCFTLFAAHLKSKRAVLEADEAEMRLEEARLLRDKIDARLAEDPVANVVVLGDFNDTKDSDSIRTLLGRGETRLFDTRPAERNGDIAQMNGGVVERRSITWTHYYPREDTYRRIDFVLLSRGMAREWIASQSYVLALPNWGLASDHRPVLATFESADR